MKNCPFCNASPKTVFDDQPLVGPVPYLMPGLGLGKSQMGARVECFQCGAVGPNFHTEEQALAAWDSAPRFDDDKEELEDLRQWKAEALTVELSWDVQEVGKALGMPIGRSIVKGILPGILALQAEKAELVNELAECELFLRVLGLDSPPAASVAADARALLAKHGKGAA